METDPEADGDDDEACPVTFVGSVRSCLSSEGSTCRGWPDACAMRGLCWSSELLVQQGCHWFVCIIMYMKANIYITGARRQQSVRELEAQVRQDHPGDSQPVFLTFYSCKSWYFQLVWRSCLESTLN